MIKKNKIIINLTVYRNDIGELIGVGLGSDFCAEHEWGIKKLKNRFKIDDTKDGIEKRAITTSNVFAGDFISNLEWKCFKENKHFVKIDRWFPSSKLCSDCGQVKQDLQLSTGSML